MIQKCRFLNSKNNKFRFWGFKDGTNTDNDYKYDLNGNLINDKNKNIKAIKYNHLNLPTEITFVNGNKIFYLYNALGQKVRKSIDEIINNQALFNVTEYLSGYQYKNNVLQFFPHAEGYVNATQNGTSYTFNYVFNFTDHLGNIRLSYSQDPSTNVLKIIEENHYYPFGLKHTGYNSDQMMYVKEEYIVTIKPKPPLIKTVYNYKYNGKEWQDELGLNVYDYGARGYMPDIGRWGQIDPLAEMYRRHTPYAYAVNNPVYFLDPDGMKVINGDEAARDKALNERDAKKAEFNSKYSSSDMKRKDFSSKKEFKTYKSAKEGLANAESSYKSAENKFQTTQASIDAFKSVDPEGFAQVDNLTNSRTGTNIDVIVKNDPNLNPVYGGASTAPLGPTKKTGELGGDGNIYVTFSGKSRFSAGETIAHEFGHAVGIAAEPINTFTSYNARLNAARMFGTPVSCQDPANRHETYAERAMDWQERFRILANTMKP